MTKMAADLLPDFFSVGSLVSCKTCLSPNVIEGEVLAFDQTANMLILQTASQQNSNKCNVQILNLNYVSDLKVKRESTNVPPQCASLNVQRLSDRATEQIEQKKRLVAALRAGVSPDGQRMFAAIKKTLSKDVTWRNDEIVVFGKVVVVKPYYHTDCVKRLNPDTDDKMLEHVRKIVEKQIHDRKEDSSSSSSNNKSSTITSSSASSVSATSNNFYNNSSSNNNYKSTANSSNNPPRLTPIGAGQNSH